MCNGGENKGEDQLNAISEKTKINGLHSKNTFVIVIRKIKCCS